MSIKDEIYSHMVQAQKDRDALKLSTLRMIRAAVKNREIDLGKELEDPQVIEVLITAIKQRKDSHEQYLKASRQELAEKEKAEIDILMVYLPEQAGEEEIRKRVEEVVAETGASSPKEMGKVMKVLSPEFKGKADGSVVSAIVKEVLSR